MDDINKLLEKVCELGIENEILKTLLEAEKKEVKRLRDLIEAL